MYWHCQSWPTKIAAECQTPDEPNTLIQTAELCELCSPAQFPQRSQWSLGLALLKAYSLNTGTSSKQSHSAVPKKESKCLCQWTSPRFAHNHKHHAVSSNTSLNF